MGHDPDLELRHSERRAFDLADGTGAVEKAGEVRDVHVGGAIVFMRLFIAHREASGKFVIAIPADSSQHI